MKTKRDIWNALLNESTGFFSRMEDLDHFIERVEKMGFNLEFYTPTGKKGLPDAEFVKAVINELKVCTGATYRDKIGSANAKLILARRKEGYELEDLLTVIRKKSAAWMGTKYQEALTPETLFSKTHFDSYLGQKISNGNRTNTERNLFDDLDNNLAKAKGAI